jgi:hypothetical protein
MSKSYDSDSETKPNTDQATESSVPVKPLVFPVASAIIRRNHKRARFHTERLREEIRVKIHTSACTPVFRQEYDLGQIGYQNYFKIQEELAASEWSYETEYKKRKRRQGESAGPADEMQEEYREWLISPNVNAIDDKAKELRRAL